MKQLLRITILLIGLIWILAWAAAGRFDDTPNTQDGSESPLPSGEIAAPGERDSAKTLRVQIQGEVQMRPINNIVMRRSCFKACSSLRPTAAMLK